MRRSSVTVLPLFRNVQDNGMSLPMSMRWVLGDFLVGFAEDGTKIASMCLARPMTTLIQKSRCEAVRTFSSCAPLESGQKKQMARPVSEHEKLKKIRVDFIRFHLFNSRKYLVKHGRLPLQHCPAFFSSSASTADSMCILLHGRTQGIGGPHQEIKFVA